MKLTVQIENSKSREAYGVEFEGEAPIPTSLGLRLMAWLASALSAAGSAGVCRSFIVSVHRQPCDHEVANVDAG